MLDGIIVFNASSGSLVFHRRFVPGFGLAGAAQQPALADPVGLALQLYAFNRFCGDIPGATGLTQLHSTTWGGGVFLAAEEGQLPRSVARHTAGGVAQDAALVLALFSRGLSSRIGQQLAYAIMKAFVEEQRQLCGTGTTTGGGGGGLRFRSLDAALDGDVLDIFVAAVARHLPRQPAWLLVLSLPHGISEAPMPRAPPAPPPEGRPSLARRMLLKLSPRRLANSSDTDAPANAGQGATVPAGSNESADAQKFPLVPTKPRAASAGARPGSSFLRLPRWRRGSSHGPTQRPESSPTDSTPGVVTADGVANSRAASPAGQVTSHSRGAAQVASCCYFYADPDLPGSSDSEGVERVAAFAGAISRRVPLRLVGEQGWATSSFQPEEWPIRSCAGSGVCGPIGGARTQEVLVCGARGSHVVVVPMQAFHCAPDSGASGVDRGVDCGQQAHADDYNAFRRRADADLRSLAAHLDFVADMRSRQVKQHTPR